MNDDVFTREVTQARIWLNTILNCHDELFKREHETRVFRSAIEKEITGRRDEWSDMERLYMTLTNSALPSSKECYEAAVALVLHFDFAKTLKAVSERAAVVAAQFERAATANAESLDIHEMMYHKARSLQVDHFACAVPLSDIRKTRASVVDENAGCCPICHNSYTNLSAFQIDELLSDFPIRIKFCGHVVGKACLEQWMSTPKIDEAKYPHRTCPLCRVEIEDVEAPNIPSGLLQHLRTDRRATETMRELVYGLGMELSEGQEVAVRAMSEEIAIEQLLAEILYQRLEFNDEGRFEMEEDFLLDKMDDIEREKRAWGFRGERVWKKLRDEWMNSGATQKEE